MTARTFLSTLILAFGFLAARLQAQPVAYNHPELEWSSTELEHCVIHVHQGLEELGVVAAQVMEEVWGPVTSLYGYVPDTRIHLIFYDTDDYSNGGAYFYNNKIIIWATSLDFDLRGQHNWLRNVLTHEFTHIVQLGAARKASRQVPFAYFQLMGYEPEKRDDVVQGFPNRIVSWPVAGTMVPAWLAEGAAQHMVEGHRYDYWDSHRDMVLRDRVVHGTLYDLDEMAAFDKSSVGGESVYNQGFSLVEWIATHYGDQALRRLSEELARPARLSMATAMKKVLGVDGHEIWRRWKADLEKRYTAQLATLPGEPVEGRLLTARHHHGLSGGGGDEHQEELRTPPTGLMPSGSCCAALAEGGFPEPEDELGPTNNLYSRVSPDGRWLYYASNGDAEWLGMTDLWRLDRRDPAVEPEKVLAGIRGSFTLTPDGRSVIFSRTSPADKEGRHLRDLYQYWFEEKLTRRLTKGARLTQPDVTPDGRRLVAIQNGGGSTWPVLLELDSLDGVAWKALSKKARARAPHLAAQRLGKEAYGTQHFQPRWHPDGTRFVLSRAWGHGRDLVEMNVSGASRSLVATPLDERQGSWSADGQWLYYACDEGGIFNIWRQSAEGGAAQRISAVRGGAFMPVVAGDTLYYSGYQDMGFRLFEVAGLRDLGSQPAARPELAHSIPPLGTDDQSPAPRTWEPLKAEFEKPFLIPRLVVDDGELKPGIFFLNTDVFEKVQLSGGVAAARLTNMDLFASASAQVGHSTVFTEIYGMARDHDSRFDDPYVIVGEENGAPVFDQYGVHYRFSLAEGHLGLRRRLNDAWTAEAAFSVAQYKASYKRPPLTVNYDYYKSRALRLRLDFATESGRRVDDFINPHHRQWLGVEVRRHWDRLIDGFEVSSAGLLKEVFKPAAFLEGEGEWGRSWPAPLLPALSLTVDAKAAWISDPRVDDFFYTYAGGLMGLKGYSYYALGGTRKALAHVKLGFPILRRVGQQVGPWHVKRLYGAVQAGLGDAWSRQRDPSLKRDVGGELRLFMTSWAMIPTAVTLGGAYGLDSFRVPELDPGESYGKEWRWYATVLFDFDAF
jgi:hypothetical protein